MAAVSSPPTTDVDVLALFTSHNQWPGSQKQLQALMKKYPTQAALAQYGKGLKMHAGLVHTPAWVIKQLGPELGNKVAYLGVDTGIAKIFLQSASQGWDSGKTQAALEMNRWWQTHNDQQKKWIISGTGDRNVLRQQAAQQMSDQYMHLYGAYKDPNDFLKGNGADSLASGQVSIDQWNAAQMRTPEFQARYVGNAARAANGLDVLTPEQYRQYEDAYKNTLRAAGVDPSQFNDPKDFANLFANDMQPSELGNRLNVQRWFSQTISPQMRAEFEQQTGISPSEQDLYGIISGQRPDLAAHYTSLTGQQLAGPGGVPNGNLSIEAMTQAMKRVQALQQARFSSGGEDVTVQKQPTLKETF